MLRISLGSRRAEIHAKVALVSGWSQNRLVRQGGRGLRRKILPEQLARSYVLNNRVCLQQYRVGRPIRGLANSRPLISNRSRRRTTLSRFHRCNCGPRTRRRSPLYPARSVRRIQANDRRSALRERPAATSFARTLLRSEIALRLPASL